MIVTYHGLESFRVSQGELTLAFNPVAKESKHKSTYFGSDIVLITLNHSDFNGWQNASRGDKNPFLVNGPGEYELKGVFIRGQSSETQYGGRLRLNTFYLVTLEGVTLCFLGPVGAGELKGGWQNLEEEIDLLFLPIGGGEVLGPAEAYKAAVNLEPKVIIPMHYDEKSLKLFLKEGGESQVTELDKLTFRKKDLESQEGKIISLKQI